MCVNSWGNLRLWQQRGCVAAAANGRCLVTTDFRSCGTFREAETAVEAGAGTGVEAEPQAEAEAETEAEAASV